MYIGKTRFGEELFKHLKNKTDWDPWENNLNLHFEYLYLDFGNGVQLNSYDDNLTPIVIFGLRIAYTFFIKRKYNMTFETFRYRVFKYKDIFIISNVFECIYEHLNLQPEQRIFIFLHIDEFQLIDKWKKDLFLKMVDILAPLMINPTYTYVQTFLSGTAPQAVINAKESSKVSFGPVYCPQLSFAAMLKIATYYAQKFDAEKFDCGIYKWMLFQPFLQLLEDTGGLPRALQYLFEECFKIGCGGKKFFNTIHNLNFDTIFANIKKRLQERYNMYSTIVKNEKLALELLHHSIDAIPVRLKTCLDPTNHNCTIENLERDAHIILNPYNGSVVEYTIMMPFIFICIYNDILRIMNSNLEETFRVQNTMWWQEWELFVANYEAFRTNLLIKRGKNMVNLGELYHGAYGTESTKNINVMLKELSVRQAIEQFPCLKLTDKYSGVTILWKEGNDVIVNGVSAKWGDSFRVLETDKSKTDPSEHKLLSIHQAKYNYHSVEYTYEEAQDEHIKNLEGSAAKEELLEILAHYHHITIIFTTQPFYGTVLNDNVFIIASNNFKQYFGPIFASRATFSLTKNINPNFSDLTRMVKCLPGVGNITAEEIIKNRPYKDEDDFYGKHAQAKRNREDHMNPSKKKKQKLDFYPFNV